MNLTQFFQSVNITDLLIVLGLFAFFILGYVQGTVRRIVGILSMVFSFFIASIIQVPLGDFLARNWTQFPPEYAAMIGYLTVFVAAVLAFTLVIQGTYKKTQLFAKYPVIDEALGGVLGVIQGFLLLMFLTIILDQAFLKAAPTSSTSNELPFLRGIWEAINGSAFGSLLHNTVIPNFVALFSFLLPDSIKSTYGR